MGTTTYNLPEVKIGDSIRQTFRFIDVDDDTPIDQSGKTYRFTCTLDRSIPDEDAELNIEVTVPANAEAVAGNVYIDIPASVTEDFLPTSYFYELKLITPNAPEDKVDTLLDGLIKFVY